MAGRRRIVRGLHKRKGSEFWQGRFRIPETLWRQRDRLKTLGVTDIPKAQEHSRSTGKLDRDEAGEAYQAALVDWNAKMGGWAALLENGPQSLSHKQRTALAADHARAFLASHEDEPFEAPPPPPIPEPPPEGEAEWLAMAARLDDDKREALGRDLKEFLRSKGERRSKLLIRLIQKYPSLKPALAADLTAILEAMHGAETDEVLAARKLHVDAASRRLLTLEMAVFKGHAHGGLRARRTGGYGEVKELRDAPTFAVSSLSQSPAKFVSLQGLFKDWWREAEAAGRSSSTKYSYGKAIEALGQFLKHDNAARIDHPDIVRFKDHLATSPNGRTGKPLNPRVIKNSYLAGLNSVFAWAETNGRLPGNAAKGVSIKVGKQRRGREPEFTLDERKAILSEALAATRRTGEPWQQYALRRWVPWLCAYTGARVGEMVQLRKQDIWRDDGRLVLRISPDAGPVKTGELRDIPLHEHLEAMGFWEFVVSAPSGHLFMWTGGDQSAVSTAKNRLREEVRKVVADKRVQPNHGWRHTFKTICSEVGIEGRISDAITGHAPRTEGERYGSVTIKAKADAIGRFPRYDCQGKT